MKKLLIAAAGLVALAAPALAADMAPAPRTYTKAPPPIVAPIYNWTGFYIGLNGGGGWGRASQFGVTSGNGVGFGTSGGLAGGQVGYNWQTGSWVFGLEADGGWANISGSAPCPNPAFTCSSNTRDLASFRGRVGWAVGSVLLYGTGGLGYANTHDSSLLAGVPGAGSTGFFNADRWGYAAGAGIEYGFTPNWSAKIEYMHYGFDSVTAPTGTLAPLQPVALGVRLDTVKVGINYRWGGPIVAKY
jgi:outer membrane immunogenic protein